MAGAILISDGVGVSMSSVAFDHILEETRKKFAESEAGTIENIYRPYDHEGMMFIDLENISQAEFNLFCRATELARAEDLALNLSSSPQVDWNELCEELAKDVRYSA